MEPDAERAGTSVADRLLGVLGAFTADRPALSLSDIARRAGLPLPTAHRLVARLVAWGALERGADGRYHVGLRLLEVASLAPRGLALRETAMPYLEDLYEATHENVHLAVRDGLEAVYVERISARSAVRVLSRLGARWPLHATAVGLVLLAYGGRELQEEVCSRPLRAFTPYTVADPAVLRRMLAEVRRCGCAVSDRQITDDAISLAAPVRGANGDVIAAVSVVVGVQDARVPALTATVQVAAGGISRALGWRPGLSRPGLSPGRPTPGEAFPG
ncbi:IclR family transcriptional regulator [Actinoallomurus rhizosphaericola]|uniref:IclR family transcriptional regulator n=1 Tax=Actinoallomurus rhizosphaericola TaxID=2952536 RepID=UPI002091FCCB|nr:IclR family transcriptional regulator [Actinoallomurus rhizosphaericola]MCO5995232.1 IclR family transcriptional regulator [Actinoallomurus rhizosphaericola]